MGRPWGIFFGFYKTRHILLSDSANCTVLRAVVLTQYRRVTDGQSDGQTDGIAVASTALAMRALRRAVKAHPSEQHPAPPCRFCDSDTPIQMSRVTYLLKERDVNIYQRSADEGRR